MGVEGGIMLRLFNYFAPGRDVWSHLGLFGRRIALVLHDGVGARIRCLVQSAQMGELAGLWLVRLPLEHGRHYICRLVI